MKPDTKLVHAGREKTTGPAIVNPPVYHASTVLFPTLDALEEANRHPHDGLYYGRKGVPTTFALETAMAELEGGYRAIVLPSGLAAITVTAMAFVGAGDHVLVPDNAYGPGRHLMLDGLTRFGVEATIYDPLIGSGIARLFQPNTKLLYLEAPGSLTFEMPDLPALIAEARQRNIVTAIDNTWATPLFYKPLEAGIDVSIHAGTKYIVGHSDAMMGLVTAASPAIFQRLRAMTSLLGFATGPDDCYLALRGLRTLGVRLARHQETGLILARWLQQRPEMFRVLHPGLPGDPGHEIWRRDFGGASGLFGLVLKPAPRHALAAMLDGLEHFGMGYSWGGFESLIVPAEIPRSRTLAPGLAEGILLRIHAGLEDPDDLIADLEAGLARFTGRVSA